uniref:Uncharacterized protein n=1 Tax=Arundo donax TaxID=35708 RepID=A0A0A9DV04_ARUDO
MGCWWGNSGHSHVHRQGGRGCRALEGHHPWPSPSVPLRRSPHRLVKAFFAGGTVLGHVSLLSKILAALTTGWYILPPPIQLRTTSLLSECNMAVLSLICCTSLAR